MSEGYRQYFRGSSAAETEDFIQAVRRCAWSEQKQFDDRWMAAYAAAQMSGPALRWHMSLPRDVQTDWSKLESALLDRFAPNPPAAAAEDNPTVPRGASAGPQLLTGRIRVTERGTGRFVGYVSNEVAKQDKYTDVITPDVKEAVIVQFAPSSLPVTFELKDKSLFQRLGLRLTGDLKLASASTKGLGLISSATGLKPGLIRYSSSVSMGTEAHVQTAVWRVEANATITPVWPPTPEVGLGANIYKSDAGNKLWFYANPDKDLEETLKYDGYWKDKKPLYVRAKLEFDYS